MPVIYRTLVPAKLDKARVDFRPEEFRRLILTKGMSMRWERAARCPCERVYSVGDVQNSVGEFQTQCSACHGRGVIYHSPLNIQALFEDPTLNPKRFAIYGESANGMAFISHLPEHTPAFLDRFTLINSTTVFAETRIFRNTVERLRFPIAIRTSVIGSEDDPTKPEEVASGIIYVRKANADGVISSEVLEEGVDVSVTADGEIDWALAVDSGRAPQIGERYSVQYYIHPTYVVSDFPFAFRDTLLKFKSTENIFERMPTRAKCWLEFLGNNTWNFPSSNQ